MKYSVKELASMLGVSKESIYIYMDILGIDKIYATSYIKVSYRDITLTKPVKRICINKPQADKIIKYKGPGICKADNVYKGIELSNGDIIVIYDADLHLSSNIDIFCPHCGTNERAKIKKGFLND